MMKKYLFLLPLLLLTSCSDTGSETPKFDNVTVVYHQESDREDYAYMDLTADATDYVESRVLNGLYPRLAEDTLVDLGYERKEGTWTGSVPVGRYTLLLEGEGSLCSILLPPLDLANDVPAPVLYAVEHWGETRCYLYDDVDSETKVLLSDIESGMKSAVEGDEATLTYYR